MAESEPQQTNRIAEMADQAIRYFQDDAQHGGRIILRAELERKFIEVAEAAVEDAREPSLYREAIEATARELGPNVDPAALAEAARDGTFLGHAVKSREGRLVEMFTGCEITGLPRIWLDKLADLRAGKGGE